LVSGLSGVPRELAVKLVKSGYIHLRRRLTRSVSAKDKERFLIWLPVEHNEIWKAIWESGRTVSIFIEVPEELGE